jgi:hypothetical protein
MKNKFIFIILLTAVFLFSVLVSPLAVSSHGTVNDFGTSERGLEMMQYITQKSLGEELYKEMEGLMVKMAQGAMTDEDVNRMVSLMNQHPGAYGMMMDRMMGNSSQRVNSPMAQNVWGMMPWGGMTGGNFIWLFIVLILCLALFIIEVLAIVWLFRKIQKK